MTAFCVCPKSVALSTVHHPVGILILPYLIKSQGQTFLGEGYEKGGYNLSETDSNVSSEAYSMGPGPRVWCWVCGLLKTYTRVLGIRYNILVVAYSSCVPLYFYM